MSRRRHPIKEIEAVIRAAEARGWRVRMASGHAWGRLLCPHGSREGCQISIWSTPRNAQDHAASIMRAVNRCPECHEG